MTRLMLIGPWTLACPHLEAACLLDGLGSCGGDMDDHGYKYRPGRLRILDLISTLRYTPSLTPAH